MKKQSPFNDLSPLAEQKASDLLIRAFCILLFASLACGVPGGPPTITPAPTPTITPVPPGSTSTPEPLDTSWQAISDGIEVRRLWVELGVPLEASAQAGPSGDRLWMVRVDPARARWRVLYKPGSRRTVRDWFESLNLAQDEAIHPRLVVNGGYFTPEKAATALVVSDGVRSGQSYVGFGGMFAVSGGRVELRSLLTHPYSPDEPLDQAVQAFPMLVHSGGLPAVTEDDGKLARRTVVGQDRLGRVLFLVSDRPIFSLKTLSAFLAASDLDLDVALNLDGGTSSGMWYTDQAGRPAGVDSWVYMPTVIVVE